MKRTAEEAAQTKQALMRSALFVFQQQGWVGATFEQIATHAGVTRGALTHHFKHKQALLIEALEWAWKRYSTHLFETIEGGSAVEQLTSFMNTYVQLLQDDACFQALAATSVLVAPQAFEVTDTNNLDKADTLTVWHDRMVSIINAEHPQTNHPSAQAIAGVLIALIQGFTVSAATRPSDLPDPVERPGLLRQLITGIMGQCD
ncbi:TetR/AcrR family transcriptional regulator [Stomatohabitans albus]|uniref:TetR/AcrR family transcriptional regulator n=1 Tax=Stomatohabitans albus TaxID=3110766 RepID=UPI00300C5CA7